MPFEPRFPSPEEPETRERLPGEPTAPYRAASPPKDASPFESAGPVRTVVRRAEPSEEPGAHRFPIARAKLTSEEVQALIAVNTEAKRTATGADWKRARGILLTTVLLQAAVHLVFGRTARWAIFPIAIAAIAWAARPLFRRDRWS